MTPITESPASNRNSFKRIAENVQLRCPLDPRQPREHLIATAEKLGPVSWSHGYEMRPVTDADQIFKGPAIDKCCDPTFCLPEYLDADSPFLKMRRVAGCDIALSEKATADFWVAVVVAIDPIPPHRRWIIGFERERGLDVGAQIDRLHAMQEAHRYEVVGVDSTAIGMAIERQYRQTLPTIALFGKAADNTVGMRTFAHEFAMGLWHIPTGDGRSRRVMTPLLEELKSYPAGAHDDSVKALFYSRETFFRMATPKSNPRIIWLF